MTAVDIQISSIYYCIAECEACKEDPCERATLTCINAFFYDSNASSSLGTGQALINLQQVGHHKELPLTNAAVNDLLSNQ